MEISGTIVDVVAGRRFGGVIKIEDGRIRRIVEHEKGAEAAESGPFIIPGFIDAHVHVESSMLIPSEFARLAVCHGTVGTVSDPHEIANVLGLDGVRFMIKNSARVPFKFCYGAPSCVPATPFETAGAKLDAEEVGELLEMPEIHYLAEMMDVPGVLDEDPVVLMKLAMARDAGKPVDGHAPGLRGEEARQYAEAGISTDHECCTEAEAREKLGFGMKILIREGSAAKNFDALIPLLQEFPEAIMFCSDDKHPNDLVAGHLNDLARRAVAAGCEVMDVLRATSLNPVRHYGMEVGLLQPGDPADFCIVRDLSKFEVLETYIDGVKVAEAGRSLIEPVAEVPVNLFACPPIVAEALEVRSEPCEVNVIGVEDGQLITERLRGRPGWSEGSLVGDPAGDILKLVVVNRYRKAPPAVGFVKGFGLKRGAMASSVAHDSHNIIATGASDAEIVAAVNALVECRGGIALIDGKGGSHRLELPVAGLMTNRDGYETAERYEALEEGARALGSTLSSPFMTLSFCALLVIPKLKLGDLGLFDGEGFEFCSLFNP